MFSPFTRPQRLHWTGIALLSGCLATTLPGCAAFFAKQSIEQFSQALQEQNLDKLKEIATPEFDHKALRLSESAKDLKILKLPSGDIRIDKEERVDDLTKKVVVKVGEKDKSRDMTYILKRETKFSRWFIHDIVLTQEVGEGEIASRTVTEQMDLLLTCREFLGTWREGSMDQKLAFCTDELKAQLSSLPPVWLDQLSNTVAGNGRDRAFRPEARMNGDRAAMSLDHPDGTLLVDFRQSDKGWQVNDLALEPSAKSQHQKGIRSLLKYSEALSKSHRFIVAYENADRPVLKDVATGSFYDRCLAAADLSIFPIPASQLEQQKYEFRQYKDRSEVLFEYSDITYMVTLKAPVTADGTELSVGLEQEVSDVTLFDKYGQVKPLTAMYMAQSVVDLYASALISRDLDRLRQLSTSDFNKRVWEQPSAHLLKIIPLPEIDPEGHLPGTPLSAAAKPEVVSTIFRGDVTEVTVSQGGHAMSYVLKNTQDWLAVDDVLFPAYARPTSVKSNLEMLLPMYAFASASHTKNLDGLLDVSAASLDRIVWRQVHAVPEICNEVANRLVLPVASVQQGDPWSVVVTGTPNAGAEVRLVREGDRYVVDSVSLINGTAANQRVELLQTVREQIAARTLTPQSNDSAPAKLDSQVMPANHYDLNQDGAVRPALFEPRTETR